MVHTALASPDLRAQNVAAAPSGLQHSTGSVAPPGSLARTEGERDVGRWLQRLATSVDQYSYRGVLVYQHGEHSESLRVTHGQVDGREYERLEYLDGMPREVVRYGDHLTHIDAGTQFSRLYRKRLAFRAELESLQKYYRLRSTGTGRLADRRTVVIAIEPRDQLRYGYRLILDYETALILGWELMDTDGAVLERFRYTTIEVGIPPIADVVQIAAGSDAAILPPAPEPPAAAGLWRAEWLPSGFGLASAVTGLGAGGAGAHPGRTVQTYSDGLAVVSVFVEPTAAAAPGSDRDGMARKGATIAYLHHASRNGEPYIVTVLGEVPSATAQQVAHSITWLEDAL